MTSYVEQLLTQISYKSSKKRPVIDMTANPQKIQQKLIKYCAQNLTSNDLNWPLKLTFKPVTNFLKKLSDSYCLNDDESIQDSKIKFGKKHISAVHHISFNQPKCTYTVKFRKRSVFDHGLFLLLIELIKKNRVWGLNVCEFKKYPKIK